MPEVPETDLTQQEARDLRHIAGAMIPASTEFGVPGADDPIIFADIIGSLGRDRAVVRQALAELRARAGGPVADLVAARTDVLAAEYQDQGGATAATLGRVILQCYYRDDRVVLSLGLEPRAPFPKGHTLEQGDWSLLDVVKARPKMWRDAP